MAESEAKRTSLVLAWTHVVWAILREDRLGVLTFKGGPEKVRKSREALIGIMHHR